MRCERGQVCGGREIKGLGVGVKGLFNTAL
jgi:hypothetical protein